MTSPLTLSTRPALYLILLFSLALGACSTVETQSFLHHGHRGAYAFSGEEMQRMQFYISREVLAHRITPEGRTNANDVIVIPIKTPGKVLETGPNWLRVSFSDEGNGTVFLASGKDDDSLYKLATEIQGGKLRRLEELSDKVLIQQENQYRIVRGANAYLLIDEKDFTKIVNERNHLPGAKREK